MLLKIIILLVTFLFSSVFAQSDDIMHMQVMTEEYPPYNYLKDGELSGLSVDLLEFAVKNSSELPPFDIRILPWPRAYQTLLRTPDTMLFSMTRTAERESLFKWAGPIASTRVVLLAKKSQKITIEPTTNLSQYLIGAIKDDIGDQSIRRFGDDLNVVYPNSGIALLKMLNADRIQLLAYEDNVLNWFLVENNYNPNEFEQVYVLEESELYYAFNKHVSDDVVSKIQTALDLAKSQTNDQGLSVYDELVSKYLVSPSQ